MNVKCGRDSAALTHRVGADAGRRSTRRALLRVIVAWPALTWYDAVFGQAKAPPIVIGWFNSGSPQSHGHFLAAFKEGLAALGWKEGVNFVVEERWAGGRADRFQPLSEELVARQPAVIVAAPGGPVRAVAKVARAIPIVQASGADPVRAGLAASFARPGGMLTGLTNLVRDTDQKLLELLIAAVPGMQRVGYLAGTTNAFYLDSVGAFRAVAERHRVEASYIEIARVKDLETAITRLAREGAQSVVLMGSSWFSAQRRLIIKAAMAQRLPVIADLAEYAEDSALLTYGVNRTALYRRAAYYVDRILKGARPGDLPIEQPATFELVVNMKTARALGLTIPASFLVRADRMIE